MSTSIILETWVRVPDLIIHSAMLGKLNGQFEKKKKTFNISKLIKLPQSPLQNKKKADWTC